ncbi:type III-B CRISPR module RAMP protein Cmr4 [Chloroflexus sp.]|uniref:type III-B CRISPR module RAMP protein Cmr4 n=1 Tax=Chloroflexus sp. TaxID=1904827 RepID=UPI002ACDEC86|nr:type III-B CRISPR module RAMP protein Cmr4 [Chloroflexus sp.]
MTTARVYFLHALSPLHAGTGQGVGVIDLPIAREKATGIPYLPGSSIKGVLRDTMQAQNQNGVVKKLFGPDTTDAAEHAGAAQFADALLLLLPIRSLRGIFAWVTSPYLLRRFVRDARETGLTPPSQIPVPPERRQALVSGNAIVLNHNEEQLVVLEDLDLMASVSPPTKEWAAWLEEQATLEDAIQRFCIVHDDVLSFLLQTATEVVARIRLQDDTKTVAKGALWYEEALPAETLLYGVIVAQTINQYLAAQAINDLQVFDQKIFQFGGSATVGRGMCQFRLAGGTK